MLRDRCLSIFSVIIFFQVYVPASLPLHKRPLRSKRCRRRLKIAKQGVHQLLKFGCFLLSVLAFDLILFLKVFLSKGFISYPTECDQGGSNYPSMDARIRVLLRLQIPPFFGNPSFFIFLTAHFLPCYNFFKFAAFGYLTK